MIECVIRKYLWLCVNKNRSHELTWMCLNYISTLFPYWENANNFKQAVKKISDGNFSQKGNLSPNLRSYHRTWTVWITSVLISFWEKSKYIFRPAWKKLVMGLCSQKGNLSTKHRSINRTWSIWITSYLFPYWEKRQNIISELVVKKKWVMGIFPKRKLSTQMIKNYFESCFR